MRYIFSVIVVFVFIMGVFYGWLGCGDEYEYEYVMRSGEVEWDVVNGFFWFRKFCF